MNALRAAFRRGFDRVERVFDPVFGPDWNPLGNLGQLGWYLFWIVTLTGVYLFIFFDTGVTDAYASLHWISGDLWWHAGLTRSLHRYASDLLIVVMLIHILREWVYDRYRGHRWFSWVTGVPILWFVYMSGITGYWLVWDKLAQYVATTTTEFLDALPIFAEPIARNFLTPEMLSSRFFTLMVFLHIAIPLLMLLMMWIHLQRITQAETRPPRGLSILTLVALVVVSYVYPAQSQAPADLATVPAVVGLDWIILGLYPLLNILPAGVIWTSVLGITILMFGIPWLPPRKENPAAVVDLDNCNGCTRCVADCPYTAITMVARTDDLPFRREALVDPDRCVSCGICMGACPSSMPFRSDENLITGIDLPHRSLNDLRNEVNAIGALPKDGSGGRVLTFACEHGSGNQPAEGRISVACIGQLPPSMLDYVLSRDIADGIALAGCSERDCQHRLGVEITKARIARERDPYLRKRVPRERLLTVWAGPSERGKLPGKIAEFSEKLKAMGPFEKKSKKGHKLPLPTSDAPGEAAEMNHEVGE